MSPVPSTPAFDRHGPAEPLTPVVLSVPHAGRDYPLALRRMLAVDVERLRGLEDRRVDTVAIAARGDATLFVARRARAWIDLNRGERERDPRIDDGAPRIALGRTDKVRAGLGLVPRRIAGIDNVWARRLLDDEVAARIERDHRPYHAAIQAALHAARARFGVALLVDVHSMPPLGGADPARIVLGDRFGRSAASGVSSAMAHAAMVGGSRVALNAPYAGGHVLDRHGAPARGIHAVQVEIDRRCYLDAALDGPGPGMTATVALLAAMLRAGGDALFPHAFAAE